MIRPSGWSTAAPFREWAISTASSGVSTRRIDAFRRALEILEPLHTARPADGEVRRALALTRTRLGDLLVRRGQNDQAEPLYRRHCSLQEAQAAVNPAPEDHWLLARTLKSQADLLRRKGDFTGARPIYLEAITALEKATAPPLHRARSATTWL